MGFLEREKMQELLNELSTGDIDESRRVDIINEIGQQHDSGLQEYESTRTNLDDTLNNLNQSRDAMAKMYNQLNAQNLGSGVGGKNEDPDLQQTVTLEELLNQN